MYGTDLSGTKKSRKKCAYNACTYKVCRSSEGACVDAHFVLIVIVINFCYAMLYRLSQLADSRSMDVSTHDNTSYDTVIAPSHSKDNKAPNNNDNKGASSNKATPNSCELIYDTIDLRK